VNPYDFLSLIAALSASQTKPTQSGINRLFSPELGVLTGTYYGDTGETSDQQEAATMLDLAPDILRASNLANDDIRFIITNKIVNEGLPVWEVKQLIRKYVLDAVAAGEDIDAGATTDELLGFADKVQSQSDNLAASRAKQSLAGSKNVFTGAGLPSPEETFSPELLAPEYFANYAKESAAREEKLRGIRVPTGTQMRSAQSFVDKQQKALESGYKKPSAVRKLYGTSKKEYVLADQLAPYVPEGAAKSVIGRQYNTDDYDPEMTRFGNVAKSIVARGPQNTEMARQRASLMKEQRISDMVRDLVAAGLTKKAQQAGYTPLIVALLKRSQFGQSGG
jgi:hypothetical protein